MLRDFNAQRPLNTCAISPLLVSEEGVRKCHAFIAGGQDAREVTTTVAEVNL